MKLFQYAKENSIGGVREFIKVRFLRESCGKNAIPSEDPNTDG